MKHGFLLIDKPTGPTSHDVVDQVRRVLPERSAGHLGTLDPAASGLLVMAVGSKALKVVELFQDLPKAYIADVELGAVSTTYDSEGVIEALTPKPGFTSPEEGAIATIIAAHFVGDIQQVPPNFSAVHVEGRRAHELARQGKEMTLPARHVRVTECKIMEYRYPCLKLSVACGSGTYVRSLAHDLGQKLRCGGYLKHLLRTQVGEWSVDMAVPPEGVTWADVIPLKEVLLRFDRLDLSDEEAEAISHGRGIKHQVKPDVIAWHEEKPIAILIPAKDGSAMARPRKVF
ncbi:MAG TPA: tRNA pseudouridine(55) synthase TruB [Candidatus Peribacteraceae bacterium]|nr:tRNA pseudouridine(55) synthase TruB [Candidatus Peribacteraceae bacterium]